MAGILNYRINDNLKDSDQMAIEVDLELANGQRRWACFFTPEGLASCGDWIPKTKTRIHLGVPHMIIVSEISEEIINRTIKMLDSEGLIEAHTKLIEDEGNV